MTYCSTAFSVINCGLKPVLVDIAKNMSCIDVDKIEKKITKKHKSYNASTFIWFSCRFEINKKDN